MSRFSDLTGAGNPAKIEYDPDIHPLYGFPNKLIKIASVYRAVAGMCIGTDPVKAIYYDKNGDMYPRAVKGADAALKAVDVLTGRTEPTKIVLEEGRTLTKPTWINEKDDECYWKGFSFMLRMAGSVPDNELMLNHLTLQSDLSTLAQAQPHPLAIGKNCGLYVARYTDAIIRTPELDLYDIAGDEKGLLLFTFEAIQHSAVSS